MEGEGESEAAGGEAMLCCCYPGPVNAGGCLMGGMG